MPAASWCIQWASQPSEFSTTGTAPTEPTKRSTPLNGPDVLEVPAGARRLRTMRKPARHEHASGT